MPKARATKILYAIKESSYYVYESSCESCILPDLGSTILGLFSQSVFCIFYTVCLLYPLDDKILEMFQS